MMTDNTVPLEVELTADSPDDIDELYDGLRGVPGITVTAVPGSSLNRSAFLRCGY